MTNRTRDDHDYIHEFGSPTTPFGTEMTNMSWRKEDNREAGGYLLVQPERISLEGAWELWENDGGRDDFIQAHVPCTIHAALFEAGIIEDPMRNKYNLDAEWVAERIWRLRKTFRVPESKKGKRIELVFEGVDYHAEFWLNGIRLGDHEGMFGGPEFPVDELLRYGEPENELVVIIQPAPVPEARGPIDKAYNNFKTNVLYGWHYVKLVTLGIWQPVYLKITDTVIFQTPPFMSTSRLGEKSAEIHFMVELRNFETRSQQVDLDIRLEPKNFQGEGFRSSLSLEVPPGIHKWTFAGEIQDVRLWWPYRLGNPELYTLNVRIRADGEVSDAYSCHFGFRTVKLVPNSSGPAPYLYNWQFVINGVKHWVKGSNWCLVDSLLRLDRNRYERYMILAKNANIELLRAWGGGLMETGPFYDLCDEMGILVWQEFMVTNHSLADEIPENLSEDMCRHVIPRLRNRPSLAVWCGGNELLGSTALIPVNGEAKILNDLGRKVYELDGTRPYRRTCPHGGDLHWYGVYWDDLPLLDYKRTIDDIWEAYDPREYRLGNEGMSGGPIAYTEWGLSSPANLETWRKCVSPESISSWPLPRDGEFVHHTPTWDAVHIDKMTRYASDFIPVDSFEKLITGMQISQGVGYQYVIERMRAGKPYTTATMFYKFTENYPSSSWAVVDYYGVPKRSYYYIEKAHRPVRVMALYDRWNADGGGMNIQVAAVNDTLEKILPCDITCRLVSSDLSIMEVYTEQLEIPNDRSVMVGGFAMDDSRSGKEPFYVVAEIRRKNNAELVDRSWYAFNFHDRPATLWNRPAASLAVEIEPDGDGCRLLIRNISSVPAIGVYVEMPEASGCYFAEVNDLWMEAGEETVVKIIRTSPVDGNESRLTRITLSAYNVVKFEMRI